MKKTLKRAAGGSDPTVRHVRLKHYLLKSRAWMTLPQAACKLLIDVWKRHNGENNGEISYACREAKHIGMSSATAARMFDVLIERGFLVVVRESTFSRKKIARTWRLTAESAFGNDATKDFMSWRPSPTAARPEDRFLVSPMRQHSLTNETQPEESSVTVSPVRLTDPIPAGPQFHQRDTYNLPGAGGGGGATRRRGRRDADPARILPDWSPTGATARAANEAGLRYGDVFDAIAQFRFHHLASGELSADWDAKWLDFVRQLRDERAQQANEEI